MVARSLWLRRIAASWGKAPIAWLTGVRRVGKTTLARQLPHVRWLNCDLPSSRDLLRDPEAFFASLTEAAIVLDEVHQLPDPSSVLKIAADEYPKLRVLATGSSTLAATSKFRDALTGRKRAVHLVPVLYEELAAFGVRDVKTRLLHGGLPPMLLSKAHDPEAYVEWLDSYLAPGAPKPFPIQQRG